MMCWTRTLARAPHALRATLPRAARGLSSEVDAAASAAAPVGFNLTDMQKEFQQTARQFVKQEVIPQAAHHDRTGEYPTEILKKAWELGLLNGHIDEKYGGLGLGVLDCAIIAEEMSFGCSGIATAAEANTLAVKSAGVHTSSSAPQISAPLLLSLC